MKCNTDITNRLQFNQVAKDYENVRPPYPPDVFERIVEYSGLTEHFNVLEIGCGTGQATLPMARLGVRLLAIEPGDHLLNLAQAKLIAYPKVSFRNCFFESADLVPNSFDLAISATAFHWIPPEIAYARTAEVLKPGGTLALFWNMMPTFEERIESHLRTIFDGYAPGLGDSSFGKDSGIASDEGIEELRASGLFTMIEREWYEWSIRLSGVDFAKLLFTFGNFQALPTEIGPQLFNSIQVWVKRDLDDIIECRYETVLHLGKRS
jgi:SAM-dependent methyltransferase